jgi:hypothetical protein
VVLPSLFEEDLTEATRQVDALLATGATGSEARAGYPQRLLRVVTAGPVGQRGRMALPGRGRGGAPGDSLAASTGVHTAEDVVKVLLAGADVAMMTSALLRNGPDHLRPVETRLRDGMDRHHYETLDQLRGRASQRSVADPAAFERANYIKTLASHPVRSH